MSKRVFVIGGLAAGLVLAAHVVINPLLAASSLRDAIEARDGETVVSRVDFPALRADLKADLEVALESQPNPMSRQMARAMIGGMIESIVSPDAVLAWGQGRSPTRAEFPAPADGKEAEYAFGLDRFTVTLQSKAGPMDVVFAPRGLAWKVVGVDVDFEAFMNAGL